MKLILNKEINLGNHQAGKVIPFTIIGQSNYNIPVTIKVKASCGCTTIGNIDVQPLAKFELKGEISGRQVSGFKYVTINQPEVHKITLKYTIDEDKK